MDLNPLATRPTLRRRVYAAFWAVGLLLGALVTAYGATDAPGYLQVSLSVYAYLGAAVGYTAQANTPQSRE